jgi:hypothetical protein
MKELIRKVLNEELENAEIEIEPSKKVIQSICDSEKFCSAQGPITFGQLRALVESATSKRLMLHVGEGSYKAAIRTLSLFIPQVAVTGLVGTAVRALNKIFRPTITETDNYKTWWGKTILKIFNLAEGDLNPTDPFSKIFFISDGLMNLMNEENKVKFARYIVNLVSKMPDDQPVPEFFVENELRNWVNQRFLLDPPLQPKTVKESTEEEKESNFDRLLSDFKENFPDKLKSKVDVIKNFVENYVKEKGYTIKFLNSCSAGFSGVRTKNQIIICSPSNMRTIGDFLYTIFHEMRHEQQMSEFKEKNPLTDYDLEDFETLYKQYWDMELDADKFGKEMVAKLVMALDIPIDFAKQQFSLSPYIEQYPFMSEMIKHGIKKIIGQIKELKDAGIEFTDIQDHPIVKRHLDKLENFL